MSQSDNPNMLPDSADGKWTEIEHLPEWDEEFYLVYTAKKHGKWVMLKTLRPEFRNDPEAFGMIRREFDARYNLAHPNILMINDFEDVPGVGLSIITDDVYGPSLRKLIDQKAVTAHHIEQLKEKLPQALQYIQENHIAHHPLRPETIIFTENIGNLKLIDVGFEQRPSLTPHATAKDIAAYGRILNEALDATDKQYPALRRIARRCESEGRHRPDSIPALQLALNGRDHNKLYLGIIIFLALMTGLLLLLNSPLAPEKNVDVPATEVPAAQAPASPTQP